MENCGSCVDTGAEYFYAQPLKKHGTAALTVECHVSVNWLGVCVCLFVRLSTVETVCVFSRFKLLTNLFVMHHPQ